MAHNFVPEPPRPPDDTKEFQHEDTKPIDSNLDLNKICYCGSELVQFYGLAGNGWRCSSCYKLIPNDCIPYYMCARADHDRSLCLYAKVYGKGVNICRDCYDGINDPKEIYSSENNSNKSLTYQKLNHTLDLIS